MSERVEIQEKLRKCLPKSRNRMPLDVVLTTFSYFSSEKSDDRNFLRKFKFDYMVVDEVRKLKNAETKIFTILFTFHFILISFKGTLSQKCKGATVQKYGQIFNITSSTSYR